MNIVYIMTAAKRNLIVNSCSGSIDIKLDEEM